MKEGEYKRYFSVNMVNVKADQTNGKYELISSETFNARKCTLADFKDKGYFEKLFNQTSGPSNEYEMCFQNIGKAKL